MNARLIKAEMLGDTETVEKYRRQIEEFKSRPKPSSEQSSSRPATDNELNKLNAKLIKAELMANDELISKYKKEIEEYKSKLKSSPPTMTVNNDLNKLSAQMIKAEMLNDTRLVEQLKAKIEELKKQPVTSSPADLNPPANQRVDQNEIETTKQNQVARIDDAKHELESKLNELDELKVKLVKAELTKNDGLVKEYKERIAELVLGDERLARKEEKVEKEGKFDLDQVFEDLIKARKANDRKRMDTCEAKIEQFERTFNFKNRDDLNRIIKVTSDCLDEVMKTKDEEEMKGNRNLVGDLDKKAKAIRKRVIEYNKRLEELIKSMPAIENPKKVESRLHPLYDPKAIDARNQSNTKTMLVRKKLNESGMSLQQMFVSERRSDADSEDSRFVNTVGRIRRDDEEYDGFAGSAPKRTKKNEYEFVVQKNVDEDERCDRCLECIKSQLIVEHDDKLILVIPEREPLVDCQLIIRSIDHCPSLIAAGEDVVQLVNQYKQKMSLLFESVEKKVIFTEFYSKKQTKWNLHFEINCYPIEFDKFEESKMCFKKEISETEGEWTMNKKLIYLTNERPISKSVPKQLSYFCVTFGSDNHGFAHVVEDRQMFSRYFGQVSFVSNQQQIYMIYDLHLTNVCYE